MNNLRKAAEAALEALETLQGGCTDSNDGTVEALTVWCPEIIDDLRAALAAQYAEPVAWMTEDPVGIPLFVSHAAYTHVHSDAVRKLYTKPLYAKPPQRKPLTDEQIDTIADSMDGHDRFTFARAIERAHGIKP